MPTIPRSVWLSLAAIAALLGVQLIVPGGPASGATPPPGVSATPSVDFVSGSAIELVQFDRDSLTTTMLVRNDTSAPVVVTAEMFLLQRRSSAMVRTELARKEFGPQEIGEIPLKVKLSGAAVSWLADGRLPARGVVVLRPTGKDGTRGALKSRDVVIPQRQPSLLETYLNGLALLAAAAVLFYGLAKSAESNITPGTPSPAWTPQSWSSNLALGGALLTSLLSVTTLPAHTHYASKGTYTTLSAFFAALVLLAPAVYGLLKADSTPSKAKALSVFSLSAAVTVWATIGQLGTAALLFLELADARLLSSIAANAAAIICAIVALLVTVYGFLTIRSYLTPAAGAPPPPAVLQLRLL